MNEEQHESTLSLSLVDGITCGLASALLLLIVFGVNMVASSTRLGGTSGMGTVKAEIGDMANEPMEIVVEIIGSIKDIDGYSWGDAHEMGYHEAVAKDALRGRSVFNRCIPGGIKQAWIKGSNAPSDVTFTLQWQDADNPPSGTVHIFRSGNHDAFTFQCRSGHNAYQIVAGFDLLNRSLESDCSWQMSE